MRCGLKQVLRVIFFHGSKMALSIGNCYFFTQEGEKTLQTDIFWL